MLNSTGEKKMKYLILMFMLLVSVSAFTAGEKKAATTLPQEGEATQLDDLMRGEMAAMKAYDTAIKETKNAKEKTTLEAIRKDHEKAVATMKKYAAGKPEILEDTKSAGAWGTFAEAWTKTRSLTGNGGALNALRQGEEHGINEYEEALKDDNVPKALKDQIRAELLPQQKKHIETLKTFM